VFNVAVVGATGAVGSMMLRVLEERGFPVSELHPLASARSEGRIVEYLGKPFTVRTLTEDSFAGVDIALFSAGGQRSREFAPAAVSNEMTTTRTESSGTAYETIGSPDIPETVDLSTLDTFKLLGAEPMMTVVRVALQDAASVAGLMITTEAMVAETPKKKEAPAMPGGGMGGMDY